MLTEMQEVNVQVAVRVGCSYFFILCVYKDLLATTFCLFLEVWFYGILYAVHGHFILYPVFTELCL